MQGTFAPLALLAVTAVLTRASPAHGLAGCAFRTSPALGSAVFTDLSSAPVGARVTVYGSGFGDSGAVTLGGLAQRVVAFTDDCVVFAVSGHGGELVVGGRAAGTLAVHAGRVLEAQPSTLRGMWSSAHPGDVVYLRAGNYDSTYGENEWCMDCTLETFKRGTPSQPIALVGYPGEVSVLHFVRGSSHAVVYLGDQDSQQRRAAHLTFANMRIVGLGACIYGGGNTSDSKGVRENTGATDIRIVNVTCEVTDARANTMTGMIALQGDRWKLLGNTFLDPPDREVIKNNHAIYIQGGADDVEVAYNRLLELHMGHAIQVHQDGKPFRYERVWIHDNELAGRSNSDMRGINVGNVEADSSVLIERNTLRNLGQAFSGIAVYRGEVTIRDNSFYAVRGPDIATNGELGGGRHVIARGNRFETVEGYPAVAFENGSRPSDVQLSANRYCGLEPQEQAPQPCR